MELSLDCTAYAESNTARLAASNAETFIMMVDLSVS